MMQKQKILLCDDEEDILDICESILQPNYEVHTAGDYDDILSITRQVLPDLIIMDLWLWGNRGEDLIQNMKEEDGISAIPIVLFSAKDELEKIANQLNVRGFLCKPFTVREFKEMVAAALPDSQPARTVTHL